MTQGDFAPLATNFGAAQGFNEVMGFLGQRFLAELHRLELISDPAVCLTTRFLQFSDLLMRRFKCIAYWLNQIFDSFFSFTEFVLRLFLLGLELLACKLQKSVAIGPQRAVRYVGKCLGQSGVCQFESGFALRLQSFLAFQVSLGRFDCGEELILAPPRDEPHDEDAQHNARGERWCADVEIYRVKRDGNHQDSRLTALIIIWESSSVSGAMMSAPHSRGSSPSVM
jgi:hypothetical protein